MSGGQANSGKGRRNGQRGTGNNPSPGVLTTIPDSSSVAAKNQRTPGPVDNPQDRIPVYGTQDVAGPSNPNLGVVNNPQNPTFAPTHKQVNSDGYGPSKQKGSKK
ncbi:hypothetical protein Pint_21385 [Pistacia integerrima]|uniref:Uncharacterized protein n=1 Tax=Pistacia integerrima TaxID=434235 RepID=A0ACC0X9X3_9ROSI|nr:hypothetical protein Pint_21385 [Pistacia integerrima]